jgi:hypothetical protein
MWRGWAVVEFRTVRTVSIHFFSPAPVSMRMREEPDPRRYVFVPWRVNCEVN